MCANRTKGRTTVRKQGSGDWIIRVFGKLSRPELHANERIRVVEYAVWIEFVRDCLTQSTGFMVYDGRLSATETANEQRRLKRLSKIAQERNVLWAYTKRRDAAAAKGAEALQKLSQTNVQHVLNALCLGIHTAQVQGWSYESVEDLFTHYSRREMAIRLGELWMSWMLATEKFQTKQMLG